MKLLQNKKLKKKKKKRTRREFIPGRNWLFKNRLRLHLSGGNCPGWWGVGRRQVLSPTLAPLPLPQLGKPVL